ncbi:hypothetical protein RCH20_000885 [Psychrobacter sp. PL15]|uniref:TnsA endonuclease N-terminal domain-containing protein n=1 Tax=Psychrobacter sp. PL15 TaxID=3071719 RepID=UPI002DFB5A09|nr:hypothetical protein [Psychrobacter sp. PL15]
MKQVRKIKPTRRSISGHVAFKGDSIAFESSLERDFIIYHSFRDDVIDIVSQPIAIPFVKNGRNYEYTPDFFVQMKPDTSKSLIVEVKPKTEWQTNWRDWSDKWKATIKFCREREFRFVIYDEDRIHHLALENINFLMRYKNTTVVSEEVKAVLRDIELRGNTTVEYVLERYFKSHLYHNQGKHLLWYLMANKMIGFNIWSDIRSEKLEIWHEY